ncbi:MAG TPA: hypothetical protein VIF62_17665, partial [Labilithrix sp.]
MIRTIDERDRRAPITLARDEPVAQLVVHRLFADAAFDEQLGDRVACLLARQTGELAAVDEHAVVDERRVADLRTFTRARRDHRRYPQAMCAGEFEIALIVRGDAHDRAGPVRRQHVVRHPDRHALAGQRVKPVTTGENALLLHRALELGAILRRGDERANVVRLALAADDLLDQRMLRRDRDERRAI